LGGQPPHSVAISIPSRLDCRRKAVGSAAAGAPAAIRTRVRALGLPLLSPQPLVRRRKDEARARQHAEVAGMAELVVLGYPDEQTAQTVYEKVQELEKDLILEGTAATVTRSMDGKLHVTTPSHAVGAGAASGALWGALFGLLFFVPVAGLVVGGLMGALAGKAADMGLDEEFRRRVQDVLQPGSSAVVLIFSKATADKALEKLAPYGGEVLRTSLSKEAEEEITKALAHAG
jgi:uncharacterized membrane protein